jgi:hypothetical protein
MAGKSNAIWTITNANTGEVLLDRFQSLYIPFRFTRQGEYDIYVEIVDNQGNKRSVGKSSHVIAMNPNLYKNYLLYQEEQIV